MRSQVEDQALGSGVSFERTTVTVRGTFDGPNFVRGLALQTQNISVESNTEAVLPAFDGGFDPSIRYVVTYSGRGFGFDGTGRYTGFVESFVVVEEGAPDNSFTFTNLNSSLDSNNNFAASSSVSFPNLLVSPLEYLFRGAQADDTFILGSFDDIAKGNQGNDAFTGLDGDDSLYGGHGRDELSGDNGDDLLVEGRGHGLAYGGAGADVFKGQSGNDLFYGGEDNDTAYGGGQSDTLFGDVGSDRIGGGLDEDILYGGDGRDSLTGGNGDDSVFGGTGSDYLYGGSGDDLVEGGAQDDLIVGLGSDDVILGQAGSDTLDGGADSDRVFGGRGTDFLYGAAGDDSLRGGGGLDQLFGGGGNDILRGGDQDDFIIGGAGEDRLFGNTEGGDNAIDQFVFYGSFGDDTIKDFEIGFDLVRLGGGIGVDDVKVTASGNDVLIAVAFEGSQTITIDGVANLFNESSDIIFET